MLFSLVYLHAIYSLAKGLSFYGPEALKSIVFEHGLIVLVVAVCLYLIVKIKKHSDKVLLFALILIIGKNFILLSGNFNKLVLALNFIYLIFAFYFFITWELQINKASFNPNFSRYDLEKIRRFQISGTLIDAQQSTYPVLITNIDDYSCFIYLPEKLDFNPRSLGEVKLQTTYEGVQFQQKARVISAYDQGLGLEFTPQGDQDLNQPGWSDLYKICLERGLFV